MSLTRRELLAWQPSSLAPVVMAACDDEPDQSPAPDGVRTPAPTLAWATRALATAALATRACPTTASPRPAWAGEPGPADLFQHGVASGDPLPDAVVL
ncbi:MAG: hypothetical protein R3F43_27780 [bacterium]